MNLLSPLLQALDLWLSEQIANDEIAVLTERSQLLSRHHFENYFDDIFESECLERIVLLNRGLVSKINQPLLPTVGQRCVQILQSASCKRNRLSWAEAK